MHAAYLMNGHPDSDLSDANQTRSVELVKKEDDEGTEVVTNGHFSPQIGINGERNHDSTLEVTDPPPRGIKRKLSQSRSSENGKLTKQASPPWKKFEADRPSSFVEEGRRKSGRTNAVPLGSEPQTGKRQTRAAYQHSNNRKLHFGDYSSTTQPRHSQSRRDGLKSPVASKAVPTKAKFEDRNNARQHALKPLQKRANITPITKHANSVIGASPPSSRVSQRRIRRPRSFDSPVDVASSPKISKDQQQRHPKEPPPRTVKSLRLTFRRPPLPILHPGNILPQPKYSSFQECLAQNEPLAEDYEKPLTSSQARDEALLLQRIERESQPGGVLHGLSQKSGPQAGDDVVAQVEPNRGPTHSDFLFTHFKMFLREMKQEHARHRRQAKALAHACAHAVSERWKKSQPAQPKTEQELKRDEVQKYAMFVKDLKKRWYLISKVVMDQKVALKQKEKEEETKRALGEMLERSSKAIVDRKHLKPTTPGDYNESPEGESSASDNDDGSSMENVGSTDDESESESDSDASDESGPGSDDDLTPDEIRKKYQLDLAAEDLSDTNAATHGSTMESPKDVEIEDLDVTMQEIDPSKHELEDVPDVLLDLDEDETDSDEETEDSGDEPSESGSDLGSQDSEELSEDDGPGLLGFFSSADANEEAEGKANEGTENIVDEAETTVQDSNPNNALILSEVNSSTYESSQQGISQTPVTSKQSEEREMSMDSSEINSQNVSQDTDQAISVGKITEVPSLLRGQLREYQHHGLDWLVGMYNSETNGILADEMGLGKTIQTIALLTHLATEKGIWGPHIIIVPTSVMLNWEMEFKKWAPGIKIMTYYGTQEERKAKRKGWFDDNKWHVCITSYQLALQDQNSLKKRNWHYMVLDEAHNIKNFRSQRWQVLLNFKAKARLLLTGTPLQNNLTELWSLLFFLSPEVDQEGNSKFADLQTFSKMFRHPVEQILDQGKESLDDEAKDIVNKLHKILRPHLLRRLKSEVEKQMPKKYEHIVKCRLSKRQRQLYDGYMGLAGTRESFASGNYMSIINCLMQLRKVCNHPDLFETRQITTSYAMPKSALADYEIKEFLVRKQFFQGTAWDDKSSMFHMWQPNEISLAETRLPILAATQPLGALLHQYTRILHDKETLADSKTLQSSLQNLDDEMRRSRINDMATQLQQTSMRVRRRPVYSKSLIDFLTIRRPAQVIQNESAQHYLPAKWHNSIPAALLEMMSLSPASSHSTDVEVEKFGFVTPAVVAPRMARMTMTEAGVNVLRQLHSRAHPNPFHTSQTRLAIAFPDKSLIQYDCGKLQQLARLLRELQAGGHRALIFTQMTRVLDILEQFMNLHGHRYLRLDGATKVEQRQALTDQFNRDTRILAFILSSRSGGLGINLTGADTVIFYDLDWNPAMDKQCQDRCHRIGQTRDVHIYRFVSEGTIEANILRKSNQKRLLDDVVIQEGEFTTEVFNREADDEFSAEADAALDKIFGGDGSAVEAKQDRLAVEQTEDKEDREAAKQAQKEDLTMDAGDFGRNPTMLGTNTPDEPGEQLADQPEREPGVDHRDAEQQDVDQEDDDPASYEDYMLRFMQWELRDFVVKSADDIERAKKNKKKSKRGKDQAMRIRR